MDGVSIIPLLESVELKNRNLRFAYKRDQVIRNKDFKLYGNRGKKSTLWQLFDLRNDESEIKDVFSENPEIAESMINDWREFDSKYEIVSGYDQYFSSKLKKKKSKN
jgi:arylsulfatase